MDSFIKATLFLLSLASVDAYNVQKPAQVQVDSANSRRSLFRNVAAVAVGGVMASLDASPAIASGGATAGKYTTIPIAKRRYYGRVQAAVHEFLLLGEDVVSLDMTKPKIQLFFDVNGLVVVAAKRKDVNGQCTKENNDCKGKEIRDSQWNDMKASMYLLGNAFRINQQKAPDNLPSVRACKAFFKEVDAMEKCVKKKKTEDKEAAGHYLAALEVLDTYLDLVELPPTDSGNYDQAFSRDTGVGARIT